MTIYGGVQMEWIFPLDYAEGPGLGQVELDVDLEDLTYFDYEFCDYIFGAVPTGISFELATQQRPYYSRLDRYVDGSLDFSETYSYDFVYGGEKQFYNSETVVENDYQRTTYSYSVKELTRSSCLDISDVLAGGIFQDSTSSIQLIPVNTGITRYSLVDGTQFIDSKTMSYNNKLRLTYEKTTQASDVYREVSYSYDDWGNQTKISSFEQVGDLSTTQVIYNQYQSNSIPDYTNPFDSLDLNSSYIRDRLRGTVITETVSGGILDSERELDTRIGWYDYNSYGQRIEERTLVDEDVWNIKNYEYYDRSDDFESGQLSATVLMDGEEELLRTDYTYEFTDDTYTQTATTRSVTQHDDEEGTDRVQWTQFDYDTGNPIVQHDGEGFETTYEYDDLDRVTSVTKPDEDGDNPVITIDYDDDDYTTTVTDAVGAVAIYQYNDLGQLLSIEKENRQPDSDVDSTGYGDSETITTELEYDGLGNITAVIDPRENRTEFLYDGASRVIGETYFDGDDSGDSYEKTYEYEVSLNRKITTNEEGYLTYDYLDMRGNVIRRVELDSSGWTYRSTESVYSMDNQPLKIEEPLDRITEYFYNASGQLRDELMPEVDGFDGEADFSGRAWRHVNYNNQGLPSSETVYLSEESSGLPSSMPSDYESRRTMAYNEAGELITENHAFTDGEGQTDSLTIKHIYDAKGREVETIDGNGISTYKEYTARDQVAAEIDALEEQTTYVYDGKDRVISMTGPRGNAGVYTDLDFTIQYKYDDLDRLVYGYLPQRADQTEKPVVALDYDKRGNLLSRTEPDGGITTYEYNFRNWVETETRSGETLNGSSVDYETTYSYDKVGNQTSVTNEMGTWTSEYDAFHRVTETTDPEGNSTSYTYDKLDNQIRMIDGNGNSSTFVYNLLGSLTEQIDAAGYSTYYDYDLLGNRTKLTDPRENSWVTKYDELGRISEEVNSRGGSALYSYDEGSRLSQLIDPNGTVISYLYYDTGLPQTVTYTNEDQDKTQTESYLYDEAGVVMSATLDGVVKEYNLVDGTYQPDPMGLISNQTVSFDGKSYSTDFSYDVMNRLSGIGYASGLEVNQSWNNLGQLEEIEDYASDFTFNEVGYLESYEQGNGVTAEYDFTDNGLLSSLEYSSGRDSLLSYAYDYDNAGNMTLRNGDAYGYDVKNQLVTASIEGDSLATEESVDYALARHTEEDILGQEEAELVEATVSLDASASSIVIDYTYPKRMSKVIVTPETVDHRITESTLAVYTSMFNNEGYYSEVEDAEISVDDTTGEITVEFESTEYARYLKLHCHFNELNADGSQDTSEASFNITGGDNVEAWALVGGRNEYYIYDGKGNRTTKSIMSDDIYSDEYEYYSDSDLLKFNGTYYYTYDDNGNMVEKGTEAEISGDTVNILSPDELTEEAGEDYAYYSYEYDLKNRLA
ncbi:MAG: hypothetical protein PQJ60_11150, partial [Spirochaetales bacterium]|nr:hypothetical protein [Spirochaetales bacterium]